MPSARRLLLTVGAVLVVLSALGTWLATNHATLHTREVVSDLAFVAAPLVAAASCWSASRRDSAWRAGWRWVGVGCLSWAAGSIVWATYELLLGSYAPFPSLADIPYIFYSVPLVVGLLRFPRAHGGWWSSVRLSLDTVVIVGTLLYAVGILILQPVLDAPHQSLLAELDALGYPLADVTIAAVVLARCTIFSTARRLGWVTLSAGLLILSLTDSTYVARTTHGSYAPGSMLDLGWVASFLAIAVAARIPVKTRETAPEPETADAPTLVQQLLPYAPIALAGWAALRPQAAPFRAGPYVWATIALGLFVAARQFVVVADHVALTRDLAQVVRRRTVELERREQWWRELVRNLSDVVIVLDPEGKIRYCSPSVRNALGHWPRHLTTGLALHELLHPDDVSTIVEHITPVVRGTSKHGFVECRVRRADDSWAWFEVTAVGQLSEEVLDGAVLTLHDVTESRRLTEELSHQAYHDALTGLPNRALLMQRIDRELARPAGDHRLALLLLDLDDFKFINDTHGHQAGDAVLAEIGERLNHAVRANDTVARLGGDEFAILMTGAGSDIDYVAQRLVEAVERPVFADGRRFVVHASIGIVFADGSRDESAQSLLAHADIALYAAKARDKGGIVIIEGDERAAAAQQVHLREQIAQPDLRDFRVVYQPLVDVTTGKMRGVEALLRWNHPDLGEISPATFIPLAEHGGSISTLGWFVMETACRQLAAWTAAAPDVRLGMGVNVSILQLHDPGFVDRVRALIEEHALAPDQLVLEITEQSLAHDFETAVGVVADLRRAGISVAVDDFGTGYSSLRYLHRFAADVVKIDRSFIANLSGSAHTQKLVRSVIDMAKSLDLQSAAEGIETTRQLEIVQALGCEIAQGYLFSPPVAPECITEMLDRSTLFPTPVVPEQRDDEPAVAILG
jgi:diguanylate cyclase (GGDEF)-like protein/PAS domain S-box-containing protein